VLHVAKAVELLLQRNVNSSVKFAGASLNLSGKGNGQLPIEPSLGQPTRSRPLRDRLLGSEPTTGAQVLGYAASLLQAIDRSAKFSAPGAVVVAICRLPSDNIDIFRTN
jgi:hypothetical protein